MKTDELRDLYVEGVKIVKKERRMRQAVLSNSPNLADKLAEMDRLEEILTIIKDELKPYTEGYIEQGVLLDVPKKDAYP